MSIHYHHVSIVADWNLTAQEMWPDSGAPETPTNKESAAVVAAYIAKHGIDGFLMDWNLTDDLVVRVGGIAVWPKWLAAAEAATDKAAS